VSNSNGRRSFNDIVGSLAGLASLLAAVVGLYVLITQNFERFLVALAAAIILFVIYLIANGKVRQALWQFLKRFSLPIMAVEALVIFLLAAFVYRAWNDDRFIPQLRQPGLIIKGRSFIWNGSQIGDPGWNAEWVDFDQARLGRKGAHAIYVDIPLNGWAGWGIANLRGFNAGRYKYLTFWVKLDNEALRFDVRAKDTAGIEEVIKVFAKGYVAPKLNWQEVKVPLEEFTRLNLSSLENVTIGFDDKMMVGKGTIYVTDLAFAN
jgi:hypothetical protein